MEKIGIVVNYFRKSPPDDRLNAITLSTELGLVMLKQNPLVGTIILVDGSQSPDEALKSSCSTLSVRYLHAGKELSIPEAYNLGWQALSEQYIGLMANDMLPYDENSITKLIDCLQQPDVGCVFPYISEGDWPIQNWRFFKGLEKTCEPSFVLLNLLFFKRNVLEKIGGVDEGYKWGYYDPIILIKLRQNGYRVVLVGDTKVIHLGRLTKTMGESYIEGPEVDKDENKFKQEYPEFFFRPNRRLSYLDADWPYKFWQWPFSTTFLIKVFWWLTKHIPYLKLRDFFTLVTLYIEPILTRYPAKYGKSRLSPPYGSR